MSKTLLMGGEYIIPEGYTLIRKGNEVLIRPSRAVLKKEHDRHCRDCKFCDRGFATNGWYRTNICLKRPKGKNHYLKGFPLYYATNQANKVCEMFELK